MLYGKFLLGIGLAIACTASAFFAGTHGDVRTEDDRKAMWAKVQQALEKSLPKTAIEELDKIAASARQDEKFDEAILAVCRKYQLQTQLEGNDQAFSIKLLQKELAQYPPQMQPVLRAILANWYWSYYQQNRWQFQQRTQTAGPPSEDFETWDLNRILAEAEALFTAALTDPGSLQKVPIETYSMLIVAGSAPDRYRPTLYDFLAQEAITFYSYAEQRSRPQDAFDLAADTPIFGPATDFQAWELPADNSSPTVKALRLFQDLMRFHAADDDRSAWLDIDLQRLVYGHAEAYGSEKDARFAAALQRFIQEQGGHELSNAASAELAELWQSQQKLVEAKEVCEVALKRHADGLLANRCRNLIGSIVAKSAEIATERVWSKPAPTIDVTYRNIDKISFRLVPFQFERWAADGNWSPENLNNEARQALLKQQAVREWTASLPPTDDYRQRVEKLPIPQDLSPGSYYLISQSECHVAFCEIWISDLAIVPRTSPRGLVDGYILDAVTGKPIAGAQVEVWQTEERRRRQQFVLTKTVVTDDQGLYRANPANGLPFLLRVRHGQQQLSTTQHLYGSDPGNYDVDHRQVVFFTDRSIYRPGQTIQFKGIAVLRRDANDEYHTIPNLKLKVALFDPNGQQVEELALTTNRFGSISGSFTAPRDRGTGQMSIRSIEAADGASMFNVEEYKRPKFFVEVDAPKTAARLDDAVTVTGRATAYTSAPIDGAQVQYRVVRGVQIAPWWYWRCWWWPIDTQVQEIAHGQATTQPDGTFQIEFQATPDRTIPKLSEPKFSYTIYADVTDGSGETRSNSRTIRVAYTALQANLTVDDWQTASVPVSIQVSTTTLDGEPQAAEATLTVHRLREPDKVTRIPLALRWFFFIPNANLERLPDVPPDWSDPRTWPTGEQAGQQQVATDATGKVQAKFELGAGAYKVSVESRDRFGNRVTDERVLQVLDEKASRCALKVPDFFRVQKSQWEVGEEYLALWGTGYEAGQALVEIEHRGRVIRSYWTPSNETQHAIRVPIDESLRGGFTVHVTHIQENRAYLHSSYVDVPWSNKQLVLKWEHFVSKLEPGSRDRWTLRVSGPGAEAAALELVAALYDASLDAFLPHAWRSGFDFRRDFARYSYRFENHLKSLNYLEWLWHAPHADANWYYRHFSPEILASWGMADRMMRLGRGNGAVFGGRMAPGAPVADTGIEGAERAVAESRSLEANFAADEALGQMAKSAGVAGQPPAAPGPDLSKVTARKNLNETAFFFPHVVAETDGSFALEFTMPEALTEWKFMGFAHDSALRGGLLVDKVVTAKDLMVQPNPPRFLREGDIVEFTAKVSNQSPTAQRGSIRLELADAATDASLGGEFGLTGGDQTFDIPAGQSTAIAWRLTVPDGARALKYKVVGATERLSDGEEGFLPVLTRRVLVKESLPLPIRGNQTKTFRFDRLALAAQSDTLQSESLTVQVTSNPAWYAVLALPYLMEFPHECNEQVFNRLYANALARHIATSNPKIRTIFDQWRGTDALDSPLEKNEDLKNILIQESPWLWEAKHESQARRNVGILFDDNRMRDEINRAMQKLAAAQYSDGTWSWFPGGPSNEFITLYITTGFARLRHLGVDLDIAPALRAISELDQWIHEIHHEIVARGDQDKNNLTALICFYLYGRSFFLQDQPIDPQHKTAVEYFLDQGRRFWPKLGDRMPQGHLALALKRFGDQVTPAEIVKSLRERSLSDEEMGIIWREGAETWWWYRAPIESQALMIEVFDEIAADQAAVEELQIWLVKQKQTQDWKTTKATSDAVYALLGRGRDWLAADQLVTLQLGELKIRPEQAEAGTGYYRQRLDGSEIRPEMAEIQVSNPNPGIAWGSVHWQYFEDMSKVSAFEGTPLQLKKALFIKQNTAQGPTLVAVGDQAIHVGDELVVRLELRVDRDMEFVHLKDYRGSGTEPVDVLSQYRYQDGLAYYQSTRDAASHFFIDYLPRGTYVFEYSTRVQLRGAYQTGFAEIQCMYAPEFSSHSESLQLRVE